MNDNIIIKTISHIHSKIVIFFLSIFIISLIFFSALLHGIHIDRLELPGVKIKELYIKWDEKFIISIEEADILSENSTEQNRNPIEPQKILSYLTSSYEYFKTIDIKKLHFKDMEASVKYKENANGYIDLHSKYSTLKSTIFIEDGKIYLYIDHFETSLLELEAKGYLLFDKSNDSIDINLDISLMNEAFFKLQGQYIDKLLTYQAHFKKDIKDTGKILKKLHLPKPVEYWSIDAIDTKSITVKELSGSIDFNNLKDTYKSIHAVAIAHELAYTYNPKLAPIETTYTLLEFKNGVLYIRPKNPKTYGFDLQKSWLKIDFTKQEELLTLFLKFDNGKLDRNILHILATYGIKVPLVQNSGKVRTNLRISVGLRKINVNAKGEFYVDSGNFHYLGMDIDVNDLTVKLENSHIQVKQMKAKLDDIISCNVDMDLHLAKHTGKIDFYVQKIALKEQNIALESKPHIIYHINKVGLDTIDVPQTSWLVAAKTKVKIAPIKIAFDFTNKKMTLPITRVEVADSSILLLSGDIFFASKKADLEIDIVKLKYGNIQLAQSDLYMQVKIADGKTELQTHKQSRLYLGNKEAILDPFSLKFEDGVLDAKELVLTIPGIFNSSFGINYNIKKKRGRLNLSYAKLHFGEESTLLSINKPFSLRISTKDGFKLSSMALGFVFYANQERQTLQLISFKKILPFSPLLQQLKIIDGDIYFIQNGDKNTISGKIRSQYTLLVKNNKKKDIYRFTGEIKQNQTVFTIEKKIKTKITKDKIELEANEIGIVVSEIQKLIATLSKENSKKSSTHFYANIKDSYLYISQVRRIIFNQLAIQIVGNETTAQLNHEKGHAGFRYKTNSFYLYGSDFNDKFMDNLFFQSKFKGGKLDFNIVGSFDEYKGIFEISDTTILDFKILNNILAFIDTIPSLVTFTLPNYSKEGLHVGKAYAMFNYKKGIFDFHDIKLHSDQLDIVGSGKASYTKNFIDFVLQLKTHIADKASKIPVVGYLIFDGETLSTTLKVSGKLTDPKVDTLLAKDISIAPLNILKRTILYPAHLLGLDQNKTDKLKDLPLVP